MYEDPKDKIDAIIENGYQFKFGDYISQGFELLQKDLGSFILFAFLSILGMGVIFFIPIVGWFGVPLVLYPVLTAGFYLVAHKLHTAQPTSFSDFFKGFDFIGQLILVNLVVGLIVQIFQLPYYFANSETFSWYWEVLQDPEWALENPPDQPPFWTYILQLPSLLIGTLYIWAVPFVIFYKMNFWDAMEASRKLVSKQYLLLLGFSIIITLIAGLGVILCCIGIFATYPAYLCMNYVAFQDVTQLNIEPDERAGIEQHLVE